LVLSSEEEEKQEREKGEEGGRGRKEHGRERSPWRAAKPPPSRQPQRTPTERLYVRVHGLCMHVSSVRHDRIDLACAPRLPPRHGRWPGSAGGGQPVRPEAWWLSKALAWKYICGL